MSLSSKHTNLRVLYFSLNQKMRFILANSLVTCKLKTFSGICLSNSLDVLIITAGVVKELDLFCFFVMCKKLTSQEIGLSGDLVAPFKNKFLIYPENHRTVLDLWEL